MYYKIDEDGVVSRAKDMQEAAKYCGKAIQRHEIGDNIVSTIFLAIDHNFSGAGEPLLFETMVFGGKLNNYQWRTTRYDFAITQHWLAVMKVRNSMPFWYRVVTSFFTFVRTFLRG